MSLEKPANKWITLSSKSEFENPWMEVRSYKTLNPLNEPTDYSVVHFKNKAIGVVPYENGHIWMVGQSRFATNSYSWEIPEGGGPEDEAPEVTARRELMEETGIIAQNMTPLFQVHLSNSITDEWGQVFLATNLTHGDAKLESTEDISVRKILLEDAYQALENGHITDALTVIAIYKLVLLKASGVI